MKKIISILFCIILTFSAIGCDGASFGGDEYDYSGATLEIKQTQNVAPCSIFEFIYENEHARRYFLDGMTISIGQIMWREVLVDGKTWGNRFLENLPEGNHKYEISIDFPYSEVPSKKLTVRINVSEENIEIAGGYDYFAEELVIAERQVCGQDTLRSVLANNKHAYAYLFYALQSVTHSSPFGRVVIDGEEWSKMDVIINELPIGSYDITVEVSPEFVIRQTEGSEVVEIPYVRKLTIPVSVYPKSE